MSAWPCAPCCSVTPRWLGRMMIRSQKPRSSKGSSNFKMARKVQIAYLHWAKRILSSLQSLRITGGRSMLENQEGLTEARQAFQRAISRTEDESLVADAWYNTANSLMLEQDLDGAIEGYKSALRVNPGHDAARFNLAQAIRMKQDQQDQQGPQTTRPAESTRPAGPAGPTGPTRPARPTRPAGPARPTRPARPTGPAGSQDQQTSKTNRTSKTTQDPQDQQDQQDQQTSKTSLSRWKDRYPRKTWRKYWRV